MLLSGPSWTAQAVMPRKMVQPDCPTEAQNTYQLRGQGHSPAACRRCMLLWVPLQFPTCGFYLS